MYKLRVWQFLGRRLALCLGLLTLIGTDATANKLPFAAQATVGESQLELLGSGVLRFGFVVDVYAAALYGVSDTDIDQLLGADSAKRLELRYYRAIEREQIVAVAEKVLRQQLGERAFKQLQPALNGWHQSLRDVLPGDRYVMEYDGREIRLSLNGDLVARSQDRRLASAYFGIWLNEKPISQNLRSQLLGIAS